MISCGAVFAFLFLLYLLVALEREHSRRILQNTLHKAYADKNLRKMEYDIAFYDEATYRPMSETDAERQVTIDELLKENEKVKQKKDNTLFAPVENEEIDEIKGTYRPD